MLRHRVRWLETIMINEGNQTGSQDVNNTVKRGTKANRPKPNGLIVFCSRICLVMCKAVMESSLTAPQSNNHSFVWTLTMSDGVSPNYDEGHLSNSLSSEGSFWGQVSRKPMWDFFVAGLPRAFHVRDKHSRTCPQGSYSLCFCS